MEKKNYETLALKFLRVDDDDIITTSPTESPDPDKPYEGNDNDMNWN